MSNVLGGFIFLKCRGVVKGYSGFSLERVDEGQSRCDFSGMMLPESCSGAPDCDLPVWQQW